MARFEVGDKVRVVRNLEERADTVFLNHDMKMLVGKEMTVSETNRNNCYVEENSWTWDKTWLEHVDKKSSEMIKLKPEYVFDIDKIKCKLVYCDTKEKAKALIRFMHDNGWEWAGGEGPNETHYHCYDYIRYDFRGLYGNTIYYTGSTASKNQDITVTFEEVTAVKEKMEKKEFNSYKFKGNVNLRHLCNEALDDSNKAFVVRGRVYDKKDKEVGDWTIMGVRRDLASSDGFSDDIIFKNGIPVASNETGFSFPYMFKVTEPHVINDMHKYLKESAKNIRKISKGIKKEGNGGHHTTVFTF